MPAQDLRSRLGSMRAPFTPSRPTAPGRDLRTRLTPRGASWASRLQPRGPGGENPEAVAAAQAPPKQSDLQAQMSLAQRFLAQLNRTPMGYGPEGRAPGPGGVNPSGAALRARTGWGTPGRWPQLMGMFSPASIIGRRLGV